MALENTTRVYTEKSCFQFFAFFFFFFFYQERRSNMQRRTVATGRGWEVGMGRDTTTSNRDRFR